MSYKLFIKKEATKFIAELINIESNRIDDSCICENSEIYDDNFKNFFHFHIEGNIIEISKDIESINLLLMLIGDKTSPAIIISKPKYLYISLTNDISGKSSLNNNNLFVTRDIREFFTIFMKRIKK